MGGGGGGGGVVDVTGAAHWDAQHAQARHDRKLVRSLTCRPAAPLSPLRFEGLLARRDRHGVRGVVGSAQS
eukprot:SM000076S21874  [mRNA]  locus=s76:602592:602804:- [translate_table: standard]